MFEVLETLKLRFKETDGTSFLLHDICARATFPSLKCVSFKCFSLDGVTLVSFLSRHANTLEYLSLSCFQIEDMFPQGFLQPVGEALSAKLRTLVLDRMMTRETGEQALYDGEAVLKWDIEFEYSLQETLAYCMNELSDIVEEGFHIQETWQDHEVLTLDEPDLAYQCEPGKNYSGYHGRDFVESLMEKYVRHR
ncbi:hypothetical protein EJ08DRAFT_108792 [Tothia fuscella]|uniref:Uncharacterized protein n=1 Tax=Tothia fuscella TaxID=1048955 RepID=A0A9P4NX03_9PEZI|nr:hypothetical protein EJ08DRAFT_108792 [Tothia fuscella]